MSVSAVKLFHEDAYRTEFQARVLRCQPAGGAWDVVLDQTCFYPAAGGQPSDTGTLGGRRVVDVAEEEQTGEVLHRVDGPLAGHVDGLIDWGRRLDHMEQHTGQHLLSGACEQLLDAHTVSWHLGAASATVDLSIESLSPEQAERVELECNRVIRASLPVLTHLVDAEGLRQFPLRKVPEVTENIRVVEIAGYDWSACAGTHVRQTGELGLLKIKAWERYKRLTRVEFLVGSRALADYLSLDRLTRELCRSLTLGVADLPGYVNRTQEEIASLRKQVKLLQEKAVEAEAADLLASASRRVAGARVVRMLFGGRPLEEVKLLAAKVAAHPGSIAVFGTRGAIPQIVLHRSVDLRIDLGGVIRQVLPLIDGKGGGSPVQAQGGGARPEALEHALDQAILKIAEALHH